MYPSSNSRNEKIDIASRWLFGKLMVTGQQYFNKILFSKIFRNSYSQSIDIDFRKYIQ